MSTKITERFSEAVDHLISTKVAKNKKVIAESMDLKPNYFSELLKGRIEMKADLIQRFCNSWPVDVNYILGLKSKDSEVKDDSEKNNEFNFTEILGLINELKSMSNDSKAADIANTLLSKIARLNDENSVLKSELVSTYKVLKDQLSKV